MIKTHYKPILFPACQPQLLITFGMFAVASLSPLLTCYFDAIYENAAPVNTCHRCKLVSTLHVADDPAYYFKMYVMHWRCIGPMLGGKVH